MKIGILTYHRAHNYGAVLQCYALQEYISSMNHEVEVIDYRQPFIERFYNPISLRRIKSIRGLCSYLFHFFHNYKIYKKKNKLFYPFIKNNIHLSYKCSGKCIPQKYDIVIIGSDQLWNKNCLGGEFDDIYFAAISKSENTKIIGYAISANRESIKEISQKHECILNRFDMLSLREKFAVDELSKVTSKHIFHCIDPTLLLKRDIWNKVINDKYNNRNYIALYQVRFPQGKSALEEKAKFLANQYNFEVIDLSDVTYSVEEFISIIKYAKCVVTSSFHGTVFSIIFNVPLYAFKLNDGSDDRYVDLLEYLKMQVCIVDLSFNPKIIPKLEWNIINNFLNSYKQHSLSFINNALSFHI